MMPGYACIRSLECASMPHRRTPEGAAKHFIIQNGRRCREQAETVAVTSYEVVYEFLNRKYEGKIDPDLVLLEIDFYGKGEVLVDPRGTGSYQQVTQK